MGANMFGYQKCKKKVVTVKLCTICNKYDILLMQLLFHLGVELCLYFTFQVTYNVKVAIMENISK